MITEKPCKSDKSDTIKRENRNDTRARIGAIGNSIKDICFPTYKKGVVFRPNKKGNCYWNGKKGKTTIIV